MDRREDRSLLAAQFRCLVATSAPRPVSGLERAGAAAARGHGHQTEMPARPGDYTAQSPQGARSIRPEGAQQRSAVLPRDERLALSIAHERVLSRIALPLALPFALPGPALKPRRWPARRPAAHRQSRASYQRPAPTCAPSGLQPGDADRPDTPADHGECRSAQPV